MTNEDKIKELEKKVAQLESKLGKCEERIRFLNALEAWGKGYEYILKDKPKELEWSGHDVVVLPVRE